jgi:hypothetical protein
MYDTFLLLSKRVFLPAPTSNKPAGKLVSIMTLLRIVEAGQRLCIESTSRMGEWATGRAPPTGRLPARALLIEEIANRVLDCGDDNIS